MLERGLDESACVVPLDTPPLSLSPDCNQEEEGGLDSIEVTFYEYFDFRLRNKLILLPL